MKGCVEKRGEGKWRLVVSDGFSSDGRRLFHKKTVTAKNKTEAETLLALFIAEITKNEYVKPDKMTVEEFLNKWLKDYAEGSVEATTYKRYQALIKKHAIPNIGRHKLAEIKPVHVVTLFNKLRKDGSRLDGKPGALSGTTCLQLYRILHKAFETGVKWQVIQKNIINGVDAPRKEDHELTILDEEQTKKMLALVAKEAPHYSLITQIAVLGGLRRSEILGLRWKDVLFDSNAVMVNQTVHYIKGGELLIKGTKTKKSKRVVPMPEALMTQLKQYKAAQNKKRLTMGDMWQDNDLIITGWNGKPFHPDNVTSWFKDFMRRIKLPEVNFHSLRHTSCSLLISRGADVKKVSARLGHSGTQITQDTYNHLFESHKREMGEALADLMPTETAPEKQKKQA